MRLLFSFVLITLFFTSCNHKKVPDVSDVKIDLTVQRFEKDLFAIDTNRMEPELDRIMAKYPSFGKIFIGEIINVSPQWSLPEMTNYVKGFIGSHRGVYDSAEKVFSDFAPYEKDIKKALQYVKYYFPSYKVPSKVITFVGPVDGTGVCMDADAIGIGLQLHLGKDFSIYKTTWVQETYPEYVTNNFEPSYIPVDAMKMIVLDMYPEKEKLDDKSLVVQMVEKGRQLYLLQSFLPETPEYKLIGYTEKQMKECNEHEAGIWALFVQNNLLQSIDNNMIKNYVGPGPKTPELGEASPGNIGSFAGWQIVKKYMDKYPDTELKALMGMDAEKLFQDAKYKP